jgi:hypothetical protein
VALSARHRTKRTWATDLPKLAAVVAIGGVIWVTLWQLHPNLLVTNSLTTGGDTGAHVALPAFLKSSLLPNLQLTGWYPGWYDGFPLYTYYFVLPDLVAALVSYVIPYGVAFKLATIVGSILMPITAYSLGKLFRLRAPIPAGLAVIMLPFLFDSTFTIDGGNLFSTLAGEYAFSLSLALALLVLGLFARGVRTGKGSVVTPIVMALCLAAHMIPYLYALLGAGIVTLLSLLPNDVLANDETVYEDHSPLARQRSWKQSLGWSLRTAAAGVALSGVWLVPFVSGQLYANPMGYVNDTDYLAKLFPVADWWVVALALLAAIWGIARVSQFAITVTASALVWALAFVLLPQGSLWNERLLPLWYLSLYLLAGWALGAIVLGIATWWRKRKIADYVTRWMDDPETPRPSIPSWAPGAVGGPLALLLVALLIVLPPLVPSVVPASSLSSIGVTVGANQVSSWAAWNYSGYQGKPAWPEYHGLMDTMATVAAKYGCGRAMWEYNSDLDRFGTPMALMLLPYWTNNCIGSQEGLFFEASATTPYHFLIQAEVSQSPSDPQVGLPYGSLDVARGVQHLQLLGVRYLMTSSSQATAQANADPNLTKVASSGPWPAKGGTPTPTTWTIYVIHDTPVVVGLSRLPVVVPGIDASSSAWKDANVAWFNEPSRWTVPLAASGPANWPTGTTATTASPAVVKTHVSNVHVETSSLSFDVGQLHKPVLIRQSYYPRWHVAGAEGPFRVSPNFMVVVPTQHHVVLRYGTDVAQLAGAGLSGLAVAYLVTISVLSRRRTLHRRRATRPQPLASDA